MQILKMLDQPPQNKMMTTPPAKKGFHFSGDGIWHNAHIWAENLEEATKEWLATRKLINPSPAVEPPQSTPAVDAEIKE
jgi:hypothetical protein